MNNSQDWVRPSSTGDVTNDINRWIRLLTPEAYDYLPSTSALTAIVLLHGVLGISSTQGEVFSCIVTHANPGLSAIL